MHKVIFKLCIYNDNYLKLLSNITGRYSVNGYNYFIVSELIIINCLNYVSFPFTGQNYDVIHLLLKFLI